MESMESAFVDVNSSPITSHDSSDAMVSSRVADFVAVKKKGRKRNSADEEDLSEIAFWSAAKRQSWEAIETNPNAFYYRHVAPGQVKKTGAWDEQEKKMFMEAIKVHPPSQGKWGLFARHIPGRVGYQCRNFYHRLLESGELTALPGELEKIHRKKGKTQPAPKPKKTTRRMDSESDEELDLSDEDDRPKRKRAPKGNRKKAPARRRIEPSTSEDEMPLPADVFSSPITQPEAQYEVLPEAPPIIPPTVTFQPPAPVYVAPPPVVPRPAPRGSTWNPRMAAPWTTVTDSTAIAFPVEPNAYYDVSEFEYESARILRQNKDNPLNMLLMAMPVPKNKSADYERAVRNHLLNDSQETKDQLLAGYFAARNTGKSKCEREFIDKMIASNRM